MKVITLKKKKDQTLGYRINNLIFAFYMILFGALLIAQIAGEDVTKDDLSDKQKDDCEELTTSFESAMIIKSWYRTPDFYQNPKKN